MYQKCLKGILCAQIYMTAWFVTQQCLGALSPPTGQTQGTEFEFWPILSECQKSDRL